MEIKVDRVLWLPPSPSLRVSVAIPVRDEAAELPRCLAAFARQIGVHTAKYEVLLVLNQCSDTSRATALAAAAKFPDLSLIVVEAHLPPGCRHVGWARRIALDEACRRLDAAAAVHPVLATTDADTLVARDWVIATLAEIDAGADLVAGDIIADPHGAAALEPPLRRLLDLDRRHNLLRAELEGLLLYLPHDPAPRHGHQTGASLALRTSLYRRVGGLPPLACREDIALVEAARKAGAAIRHSPFVRVITSVRLDGRARGGMAATLKRWERQLRDGNPVRAESASSIERRIRAAALGQDTPPAQLVQMAHAVDGLERRVGSLRASAGGSDSPADTFPRDGQHGVEVGALPAE